MKNGNSKNILKNTLIIFALTLILFGNLSFHNVYAETIYDYIHYEIGDSRFSRDYPQTITLTGTNKIYGTVTKTSKPPQKVADDAEIRDGEVVYKYAQEYKGNVIKYDGDVGGGLPDPDGGELVVAPSGGLELDLSIFGVNIVGNRDRTLTFKIPDSNLYKGGNSLRTDTNKITNINGTIDDVIKTSGNSLLGKISTGVSIVVAVGVITLIGFFTYQIILLGSTSTNAGKRESVLKAIGYAAVSLAVLGSIGLFYSFVINIFN